MLERLRIRWWRLTERAAAEDGLTLVEVLIAGFVLTVAVLALASVASASLTSIRDSRERDRATATASSALESIRAMDYDDIALRTGDAWASADEERTVGPDSDGRYHLDHDADGDHTEEIWHSQSGAIDPYLCTSAEPEECTWFDPPVDTRVTARAFVSWYCGDDAPDCGIANHDGKRVTVVATWEDPAFTGTRTVRMSTVISPASRGMPAPAFEVIPDRLTHTYDRVSVDEPYEHCFDHVLNNFGARDSYDVVPGTAAEGWTAGTNSWTRTVGGRQWHFRAELQPEGVADGASEIDMAEDGAQSLASSYVLDTGRSARISFCYTPGDGDYAPQHGEGFSFTPRVRSRFDPNVHEDITHEIDVEWQTFTLYPHHHPDVAEDPPIYLRPIKGRANVTLAGGELAVDAAIFDQMPMYEVRPPELGSLPNYDLGFRYVDLDDPPFTPSGWPLRSGTFLPPNVTPVSGLLGIVDPTLDNVLQLNTRTLDGVPQPGELFAAEWDYHFPPEIAPLTLDGTSTLTLWASYDPQGGDPPPQSRECLRAELIRNPGEGGGTVVASGASVANARPNWIQRSIELDWTGPRQFQTDDFLRLRVWVDGYLLNLSQILGGDRCVGIHIGYGAEVGAPEYVAVLSNQVSQVPE